MPTAKALERLNVCTGMHKPSLLIYAISTKISLTSLYYLTAQALVYLCRSNDPETLRFALLTLELLAIESSDVVCAQVSTKLAKFSCSKELHALRVISAAKKS